MTPCRTLRSRLRGNAYAASAVNGCDSGINARSGSLRQNGADDAGRLRHAVLLHRASLEEAAHGEVVAGAVAYLRFEVLA